jgi:hypothetical protein
MSGPQELVEPAEESRWLHCSNCYFVAHNQEYPERCPDCDFPDNYRVQGYTCNVCGLECYPRGEAIEHVKSEHFGEFE